MNFEEKVARGKEFFDAFWNARDIGLFQSMVEPDCLADWTNSMGTEGATYRGPEGLLTLRATLEESFEDLHSEPVEWLDLPESRCIVRTRLTGAGRASGIPIEASGAFVFELRGERLCRVTLYQTVDEAKAGECEGG